MRYIIFILIWLIPYFVEKIKQKRNPDLFSMVGIEPFMLILFGWVFYLMYVLRVIHISLINKQQQRKNENQ